MQRATRCAVRVVTQQRARGVNVRGAAVDWANDDDHDDDHDDGGGRVAVVVVVIVVVVAVSIVMATVYGGRRQCDTRFVEIGRLMVSRC